MSEYNKFELKLWIWVRIVIGIIEVENRIRIENLTLNYHEK